MKQPNYALSVFLAALLAFGGVACNKQAAVPQQYSTLDVALQELRASLVKSSPEVQSNFYNGVDYNIRYDNYAKVAVFMDKIASDPSLNDKQKKIANKVIDLLKQKMENPQSPANVK